MDSIFKAYGSVRALAEELDLPYTTVHSWKARGRIPYEHHDAVILACSRRGVPVTHKELRQVPRDLQALQARQGTA